LSSIFTVVKILPQKFTTVFKEHKKLTVELLSPVAPQWTS